MTSLSVSQLQAYLDPGTEATLPEISLLPSALFYPLLASILGLIFPQDDEMSIKNAEPAID